LSEAQDLDSGQGLQLAPLFHATMPFLTSRRTMRSRALAGIVDAAV
jgi:hypothetical protein